MAVLHSSWFIIFAGLLCVQQVLHLSQVSSFLLCPRQLFQTSITLFKFLLHLFLTFHRWLHPLFQRGKSQRMQELDNFLFHPQTNVCVNIMYLSSTFYLWVLFSSVFSWGFILSSQVFNICLPLVPFPISCTLVQGSPPNSIFIII